MGAGAPVLLKQGDRFLLPIELIGACIVLRSRRLERFRSWAEQLVNGFKQSLASKGLEQKGLG